LIDENLKLEPIVARDRLRWVACACIVCAVVLLGNADLLMGRAAPIWDATDFYSPLFSLVADHAKAGKLLLWNPWMNGGSPDCADPQSGAGSPVILLLGLLFKSPLDGFVAYWLAFWMFGGLGMLALCRHLKSPAWGGLVASLGFVSCGFYTGHGEHTSILYSFSFLPWIVWRFDLALSRRSYWIMIQAGALWGLSGLGGYPAIVILDSIFLTLWAVGRVWFTDYDLVIAEPEKKKKVVLFAILGLCLVAVTGIAIMSPGYIGFLEYAKGYTTRVNALDRHRVIMEYPLPPQALSTLASPFLYLLNWPPYKIWPETDISLGNAYVGALTICLAVIALFRYSRWRWWLAFIIVLFMSAAVGGHLPVRGWFYDLVPLTRYFRFPALFDAHGLFGLCLLAALAARDVNEFALASDARGRRVRFLIAAAVAVAACYVYVLDLRVVHLSLFGAKLVTTIQVGTQVSTILLLFLWISIVAVFFLWWRGLISRRLLAIVLASIAVVDAGSTLRISEPTLYSAASLSWWKVEKARPTASLDLTPNGMTRHLLPSGDLGTYQNDRSVTLRDAVFANDTGMVNQFFQPYVNDSILNQLAIGSDRIWFSADAARLPVNEEAFAEYTQVSHTLGVPPLILHSREQMMKPLAAGSTHSGDSQVGWSQSAVPVSPASIDLLAYFPNTLLFRYDANQDGWLLVTDRWARDWKAEVNGKPVEVLGANFLFRAVPVTRGENTVRFHYAPKGYVGLLIVSWGTLLLIAAFQVLLLTRAWRAKRRDRQRQYEPHNSVNA
jgi:Bacterial membrane protein YfhO